MGLFISLNPPILRNNITKIEFEYRFPNKFKVRSLTGFETMDTATRLGWHFDSNVTLWEYIEPFVFESKDWGRIEIPAGFITDFASVPGFLHSIYDDDSPTLLYPSAPHDLLFTPAKDRKDLSDKPSDSCGWLTDGRQLTLEQCNKVLVDAMWYCGADDFARAEVYGAVQMANLLHANKFASKPAIPN
jgi:hypothetical protein